MERWIAALLVICLSAGFIAGCGVNTEEETTMQLQDTYMTEETIEETEPTEVTEPDDGSFKMYYDDRLALSVLTGAEPATVEILDQQVTSVTVDSGELDAAVLHYDAGNNRLIAVGTGKATVVADGQAYPVTVRPAPISLVMIIGHSLGAGQCGVEAQSVLCEEGQAYSSVLKDEVSLASGQGIGWSSAVKPNGIDAFTPVGEGRIGEGAGLAYQWNKLTGEKIWVLNAAKGGTCLPEWVQGSDNYINATTLFSSAQFILSGEIRAGHYKMKDMAVIYHSAANFNYKNVEFDNELLKSWYESMCNGFREAFAMDMNGDGKVEKLKAIGFVPCWTEKAVNGYTLDRPANMHMAASREYPEMFIASIATKSWIQDISTFPKIEYQTHGEAVKMPNLRIDLYASDGAHMTQEGYNAAGMDIADNLYSFLRLKERASTAKLVDTFGSCVNSTIKLKVGNAKEFVVVLEDGNAANLTFEVTDNLQLSYPLCITGWEAGEGTLTIRQADEVLMSFTVIVE